MKFLKICIWIALGGVLGFLGATFIPPQIHENESDVVPIPTPKPLLKFSFKSLQEYRALPSVITLNDLVSVDSDRSVYSAYYTTNNKHMSLQIMVPETATPSAGFPVLLLIRGFVDPLIYQPGVGTKNAARYFSNHGYVTIAPDFLGFGTSDQGPTDTLEARFERPQQLLDLIASFDTLPFIDASKIGIWGHSNGGQITLSLLEVSQKAYPSVLWAPVTKPFPYSVLYYADESEDGGKSLRKVIAQFEKEYDVFDFSQDKYIDWINAPIELHQGTEDPEVPLMWSNTFVENLKKAKKDITYFTYPGADHNLQPAWNLVIQRSLEFFNSKLEAHE